MRRRLLTVVTASMILMMVLPPVFNVVDKWDKGPELPLVGHDTETTLMMAAFDVGLGVAVAWSAVCLLGWLAAVTSAECDRDRCRGSCASRSTCN